MSDAKKCDICEAFYTEYTRNFNTDYHRVSYTSRIVVTVIPTMFVGGDGVDLCQMCFQRILSDIVKTL